MPDPQTSDMRQIPGTVNDVSASSGISSPYHAVNSMSKRSSICRFMLKISFNLDICALFSGLQTRFY